MKITPPSKSTILLLLLPLLIGSTIMLLLPWQLPWFQHRQHKIAIDRLICLLIFGGLQLYTLCLYQYIKQNLIIITKKHK